MREYKLKDIYKGLCESFEVKITPELENKFRDITQDLNLLHIDDEFANEILGGNKGHAAFGMLTASFLSTLAGMYLPGRYSLIHSVEVSFIKPVYAGDVLLIKGVVDEIYEELRMIKLKVNICRLDEVVCKAKMKVLVMK
ncbi:MAG: hypothetical protein II870_03035 [Synergistaceae bacterium]|nr:hypothetical protein [Synergistaceae bacterium]